MSHEPECFLPERMEWPCICDRLRLARDRGYGDAMDDGWGEPGHIAAAIAEERAAADAEWQRTRQTVWDLALDAAREAVAAVPAMNATVDILTGQDVHEIWREDALAAIDALKEDK